MLRPPLKAVVVHRVEEDVDLGPIVLEKVQ
jgi:folate-dependent phosphoribosylglycinamide formyltransferase PurN